MIFLSWLGVLGWLWLLLVHRLSAQWSIYEQYHYAWAVPFLCAYLLWRRSQTIDQPGSDCSAHSGSALPCPPATAPSRWLTIIPLLGASALYPLTRWLHEANPLWRLTTLLWALELVSLSLCSLYWFSGPRALRRYWLGVTFFLLAVPWPSAIENCIVQSLTHFDTTVAVDALGLLGVPALQHANVIETAAGAVGVDDACSGIQSLQATLMLSVFFGEFHQITVLRRILLILAACPMTFLCNLARTTLLAWLVSEKGLPALALWHDPAGVSVLMISFLGLWLLAFSLAPPGDLPRPIPASGRSGLALLFNRRLQPAAPSSSPRISSRSTLALILWFTFAELGTASWYWLQPTAQTVPVNWSINPSARIQGFHRRKMPADILTQFQPDSSLEARWELSPGSVGQLHYFRWLPAHSVRKQAITQLAKAHAPEICLPELGITLASDYGIVSLPIDGMTLALQHYAFCAEGTSLHVFFGVYEDSTGPGQLASRGHDLGDRFSTALAGHRYSGLRFLEIVLFDVTNQNEAVSTLRTLLPHLVHVDTTPHPANPGHGSSS